MNIFEGSRRIAKVVAGIIVIGSIVAAALDKPYVAFYYGYDENGTLQSVDQCFDSSPRFYPDVIGQPDAHAIVCGFNSGPEEIQLPADELDRIGDSLRDKRFSDLGRNLSILAAVLLIGWALTWATGWVVRGFMGIPRRQDSK